MTICGCSNAKQGAVSGAAVGALSGLAIGSLSGNAGKGAAIGAVVGGVGGAVIGDQNRRRSESEATPPPPQPAAQPAPAPTSAPLTQTDRDRLALAKFARSWTVSGWETVDGRRVAVSGTALGAVDNDYFIRMQVTLAPDGRPDQGSTGNIVFGSEPGRGLTMTNRFNTSPSSMHYQGRVSADGNTFTLDESGAPSGARRRIVIRFLSPDEFIADVSDLEGVNVSPQASFRFTGD